MKDRACGAIEIKLRWRAWPAFPCSFRAFRGFKKS